jgi:hypothetical protein
MRQRRELDAGASDPVAAQPDSCPRRRSAGGDGEVIEVASQDGALLRSGQEIGANGQIQRRLWRDSVGESTVERQAPGLGEQPSNHAYSSGSETASLIYQEDYHLSFTAISRSGYRVRDRS